jgi:multidrug efflux system membrane fusion protein
MKSRNYVYYLCAAIFLMAVQGCGKKEVEQAPEIVRPVKTIVIAGAEAFNRSYPGKVRGAESVTISFRVSGPLTELAAKEGDKVSAGDLLAKIDSRDYDIALTQAKAEFGKADADYQRYQKLYEKDAVALADLDLYRSKKDVAKAQFEDAAAAVKDTVLRAPFDGQVGKIFIDNFQEVNAKEDILSIYDSKNLEIAIDLPESIVSTYQEGTKCAMKARFEVAPDASFDLSVKEFSTQADPMTQTYQATLMMPTPENLNILPGMTATVDLKFAAKNLLKKINVTVPSIAVFPGDSGESFVWVVDPNQLVVNKRQIKVGGVSGSASIEVLEGLKTGDRVVTAGIKQLREGMQVKLLN